MSDETQTEEEPSIEEILDSIRQIISEDDEEKDEADVVLKEEAPVPVVEEEPKEDMSAMDQSAIDDMDFDSAAVEEEPVEPLDQSAIDDMDFDAPTAEADEGDEPLELTDKVSTGDDKLEVDMVDEAEVEAEVAPEPIEEDVDVIPEAEPVPEPVPEQVKEDAPIAPEVENDDILTDQAKEAAFSAMTELVRKTAVNNAHGLTLEDIVRSELKPLLRSWLDEHLPTVIDRLVREELERVSKRVLED